VVIEQNHNLCEQQWHTGGLCSERDDTKSQINGNVPIPAQNLGQYHNVVSCTQKVEDLFWRDCFTFR
jgi:hypothetical protein